MIDEPGPGPVTLVHGRLRLAAAREVTRLVVPVFLPVLGVLLVDGKQRRGGRALAAGVAGQPGPGVAAGGLEGPARRIEN